VLIDGKTTVRIKRVISEEGNFQYELRESGEIISEERLSLLKN
jgi:hypothetical protein